MTPDMQTVRDLVEEAKKRIVLLFICVIGLSYLMSLTSSSVWINLPVAASLIVLLRYLSYDLDMRRKAAGYNRPPAANHLPQKKSLEGPKLAVEKSNWKRKVNSPPVEAAIDQFTRRLVSEWITNLWYSRLTPDRDAPEELVQIMDGVLGEISVRVRDVNLIDLLTRDIINLLCNHLELYRIVQAKIGKHELGKLPMDYRDAQLKRVLATENKLHPALFSAEAEHKVLQHLMDGLISYTFKPEDLQCCFFRYTVRELLACAVMRPVLNLANPRFINERIESFVISVTKKADKVVTPSAQDTQQSKSSRSSRAPSDHFSGFIDRSVSGVELVQFKPDPSRIVSDEKKNASGIQKDQECPGHDLSRLKNIVPVKKLNHVAGDAHSSHCKINSPSDSQIGDGKDIQAQRPGQEWGQMLDIISTRKTRALAPEHFENMWTKGRNYKKDNTNLLAKQDIEKSSIGISNTVDHFKGSSKHQIINCVVKGDASAENPILSRQDRHAVENLSVHSLVSLSQEKKEHQPVVCLEEVNSDTGNSYTTEDDESSGVTGLDSPGIKVWDSKNNRSAAVSHVRHPLESSEGHLMKKNGKDQVKYHRPFRAPTGRKMSKSGSQKVHVWQEVERTSFLLGDGRDILNASKGEAKSDESSDDPETESWGRVNSGAAASSSSASISVLEASTPSLKSSGNSELTNPFLKLKCEVLGANVVKSGSKSFAVYSISVIDVDNNTWSIKRRFRHFEELHRRLKEFPEYNLSLPPKHFLSSGLDMPLVHERCRLLDKYLKKLFHLPNVSRSIEVWDFLSVDSQTYIFSNSLSIVETLSVDLDDKLYEKGAKVQDRVGTINDQLSSRGKDSATSKESALPVHHGRTSDSVRLKSRSTEQYLANSHGKDYENLFSDHSESDTESRLRKDVSSSENSEKSPRHLEERTEVPQDPSQLFLETASDPTVPTEWVPPNLSVPILDLVDVIFQLQDGGWIRRQAFWVAKQVLQLGMGDAFDDWLIEKIQLLRKGPVIASGIKRIEQILWPDGIFITKHPKRQRPPPSESQIQSSQFGGPTSMALPKEEMVGKSTDKISFDDQQQLEADRRAKFVRELMIDNAPAALVGLVGRKEYEHCAQDVYFFLQSAVCLKQLAYELLELLLLAAFPELHDVVKVCHEEKEKFGEVDVN